MTKAQRGAVKLIKKGKISSASILIVSEYFAPQVFEYLVPIVFEHLVLWRVGAKKVTTQ